MDPLPDPVGDLIRNCALVPQLAGTTRSAVLAELVDALGEAIPSPAAFLSEVEAREAVQTTDTGRGLAFPHARSSVVPRLVLAIGRSADGIRLGDDSEPVHLVFLFGIPPEGITNYLEAVAWLVKSTRDPDLYRRLMQAESPGALRAVLCPTERD